MVSLYIFVTVGRSAGSETGVQPQILFDVKAKLPDLTLQFIFVNLNNVSYHFHKYVVERK